MLTKSSCITKRREPHCFAGETIPASDSEDEAKGDTNLEGIYYEQEAFVVAKAIEKFGCVSSTIKALSEQLKCNSGQSNATDQ